MRLLIVSIGLLGLLGAALAVNVGRMRGKKQIFLGDGGDTEMLRTIRAHANFIEFVPLTLILILVVMDHYGGPTSGVMAAVLLVSRVLHAGGMLGYIKGGRSIGATGTIAVLVAASIWALFSGIGIKLY